MALPKKGSRLLQVEGIAYRWRIRKNPTNKCYLLTAVLAVERADDPGAKLVVSLPEARLRLDWNAPVVPILPSDVTAYIRSALAVGWHPEAPGKNFFLPLQ